MRLLRQAYVLALLASLLAAPGLAAPAGFGAGTGTPVGVIVPVQAPFNAQKDCQTVRTCDFRRSSSVRGCLSSFTCRSCRMVAIPCSSRDGYRVCQEMRCGWGG